MNNRYKTLLTVAILLFVSQPAMAQFTASGIILDEHTGDVLVGANIFHAESNTGTTSDSDGRFSIDLPGSEGVLRISYIGYLTKNIDVNTTSDDITIELSNDIANLEEVIVTGLASSVKRSNLANSVSSISAQDLAEAVSPQTLDGGFAGQTNRCQYYT